MKRKFTTNSRLVNDIFANYFSTFVAFCELINNSLQAKAKNIKIDLVYTPSEELHPTIIKKIVIEDDGIGVHINDLDKKILDIGTTNKEGGKGIGRFAAFQIGKEVEIETVGYNIEQNTFSKVLIPLSYENFRKKNNVSEVDIDTQEELLKGKHSTFYRVSINSLYDSTVTKQEPKKKITDKFLSDKIKDAIFERYPLKIFNKEVFFQINGIKINPDDFIVGIPEKTIKKFTDKKGEEHQVFFDFIQIKKIDKIKVFLTIRNAGIHTIASGFEYEAEWLSPKIGGWFIYIASETLPADMYRNVDLDGMDESVRYYKDFVKQQLNQFFKEKNKEFDDFSEKLKKDLFYPYREKTSSQSKVVLFDKLAYFVEDKYHILNSESALREIIYPLIDRTISNGELNIVLRQILKLNNKMIMKFSELLEKTQLENIIEFLDKVASKLEDIEFLEKLVYSEVSKNVKERKELHKILEKMLWVFGEEYDGSSTILSDKGLENNLTKLREETLIYKSSKKDDNVINIKNKNIKSITDLFMYSNRILDYKKREVLVVELKAPKVKISPKELGQVMKYAREIEKFGAFPDAIRFKILLISSDINDDAKFQIKGNQKGEDNPYFYFRNEQKNIEIWVLKWAELIENVKRKLTYMSSALQIKDIDVQEKAKRDFEEIGLGKVSSTLKKVNI